MNSCLWRLCLMSLAGPVAVSELHIVEAVDVVCNWILS